MEDTTATIGPGLTRISDSRYAGLNHRDIRSPSILGLLLLLPATSSGGRGAWFAQHEFPHAPRAQKDLVGTDPYADRC